MAVETHIYDDQFFKNTVKFEEASAAIITDIIINFFQPRSVIDIGCGVGLYLKFLAARGVAILGYDGAPAALLNSQVGDKIKIYDLSQPLNIVSKFDLALCLEVAEHLPLASANTLVETLCNLAPIIFFTAAIPGQGPRSIGHINEQPHDYWVNKFQERQYKYDRNLSLKLRKIMKEQAVVWWISQNLMVFKKE